MARAKYSKRELDEFTSNQEILKDGKMGVVLDLLGDENLTFYEWADKIKTYVMATYPKRRLFKDMPTKEEMSFIVLRLLEEGLVEMSNTEPCKCNVCLWGEVGERNGIN